MTQTLVTIVTGGGRGIGRAISQRMARETAVLAVGQQASYLESVCAEIRNVGGVADFLVGDVARPETAKLCLEKVAANGWLVRNLICNAGTAKGGAAETFDDATFSRMVEVNISGSWWFIKACLPSMIEQQKGTICLMSSVVALSPCKYDAPYCATKSALLGMAGALALEQAKNNIVVVPLCPSFVESDMTNRSIAGVARRGNMSLADARAVIDKVCPGGVILPAEEMAEHVAKICIASDPSLSGKPYEIVASKEGCQ